MQEVIDFLHRTRFSSPVQVVVFQRNQAYLFKMTFSHIDFLLFTFFGKIYIGFTTKLFCSNDGL